MTIDGAIKVLIAANRMPSINDGYLGEAIEMAIKSLEAWELVKQEIEQKASLAKRLRSVDLSDDWYSGECFAYKEAMEIIDKHLSEVENE